ncbi:hypothetical protein [Aliikangiella maris]|uniref:Uncharacterized protein n=2 Tax=Aliikangiella maris TaxID=3162458 RepID=A0ABV3MKS8_9GAMM
MKKQPELISSLLESETPPNCEVNAIFLNAINHAITEAGLTRKRVVSRMNKSLGGKSNITESKLNKWLAPGSDRDFPMTYLPALCWALKSTEFVNALLKPIQFRATDPKGQNLQLAAQHLKLAKELTEKADKLMTSEIS